MEGFTNFLEPDPAQIFTILMFWGIAIFDMAVLMSMVHIYSGLHPLPISGSIHCP